MNAPQRAPTALELLVFELAGARFGVELERVREVVRAALITPLPGAPPVVEGVVDVRGTVVPVYDLRLRFGLPARRLHPDERLVIAWTGARLAGFRCDATDWIEQVNAADIERGVAVRHDDTRITGVARLEGGLALIHDLTAFLDEAERMTLEEALAARDRAGAQRTGAARIRESEEHGAPSPPQRER